MKSKSPELARFAFVSYQFTEAKLSFIIDKKHELAIEIEPQGRYNPNDGEFDVFVQTTIINNGKRVIEVTCVAKYKFERAIKSEEIPNYFYANSIAIIFPYIRAFISTLSVQANIPVVVIPTINLTSLGPILKQRTNICP